MEDRRARIMIVGHDWDDGIRLADWLATRGYQPVLIRSVEAAMGELSAVRPHAVVLDVGTSKPLSQIVTTEVWLLIRTACPRIPVITVVEQGDAGHIPAILRKASRHCLVKPVAFSDIASALASELGPPSGTAPHGNIAAHAGSQRDTD